MHIHIHDAFQVVLQYVCVLPISLLVEAHPAAGSASRVAPDQRPIVDATEVVG